MSGRPGTGQSERLTLWISVWCSLGTALVALALGIVTETRIIVFDGAYISVGLLLSFAAVRAAAAAAAEPDRRFPFGRDALTPLVVLTQGLAIAGTLIYAMADALILLRTGGAPVNPLIIAVYGALTAVVGFSMARWLARRTPDSDLVAAEAAQWRAGAVLSVVMLVGATLAAVLDGAQLDGITSYIDPILVLIACGSLAAVPVRLITMGLNELLEGSPPSELMTRIEDAVEHVRLQFGLDHPVLRAGKVGRKLYVEVDFTVVGGDWQISDEDDVRRATIRALEPLGLEIWANVSLTGDPTLYT